MLGTRGVKPIRMGEHPISPDVSPRLKLGANKATPGRVSPIRMCDLTAAQQSMFLPSSRKKVDRSLCAPSSRKKGNHFAGTSKSPKTRRCLMYRDDKNEMPKSRIPNIRKPTSSQNSQQREVPKIVVQSHYSNIPRAGGTKNRNSTASTKRSPRGSVHPNYRRKATTSKNTEVQDNTSGSTELLNHVRLVVEEQTSKIMEVFNEHKNMQLKIAREQTDMLLRIAEDQKKGIEEIRGTLSEMLLEQRKVFEALKRSLEVGKTRNIARNSRRASDEEFSYLEAQFGDRNTPMHSRAVNDPEERIRPKRSKSLVSNKENSSERPARKSLAVYREMRKSFSCLGTPASARKLKTTNPRTPRTPRSILRAKVDTQLQDLLDT